MCNGHLNSKKKYLSLWGGVYTYSYINTISFKIICEDRQNGNINGKQSNIIAVLWQNPRMSNYGTIYALPPSAHFTSRENDIEQITWLSGNGGNLGGNVLRTRVRRFMKIHFYRTLNLSIRLWMAMPSFRHLLIIW